MKNPGCRENQCCGAAGFPQALQLRYLQTLADISTQKTSNTIIFPVPMEMMTSLLKRDGEK